MTPRFIADHLPAYAAYLDRTPCAMMCWHFAWAFVLIVVLTAPLFRH